MNTRSNQGGSVASFIIIGVVLVIMTTGVLYWVRHKDTPVAREETPVATAPDTNDTKQGDEDAARDEAPQPTTETTPSTESQPAPAPVTQPTVTSLSQTGPADTALQLVAAGALVAITASFTRSRKLRSSL